MSMTDGITASGDTGHSFVLRIKGRSLYGDLLVSLAFELPWASGTIEVVTQESGFHEFQNAIVAMNGGESSPFVYMSHEGDLEVTVKPTGRGDAIIEVNASPDMVTSDRIVFELQGTIREV